MIGLFEHRFGVWAVFSSTMLFFFWGTWATLDAVHLSLATRGSICIYIAWIVDCQAIYVPHPATALFDYMQLRRSRADSESVALANLRFYVLRAVLFGVFSWLVWDLSLYMNRWYQSIAFYWVCSSTNFAIDQFRAYGLVHWRHCLIWTARYATAGIIPMLTMGWAYMYSWIYPPYHFASPTLWALVFLYIPSRHVLRAVVAYLAPAPSHVVQRSLDVSFDIPMAVVIYTVPDFHIVWLIIITQIVVDAAAAKSPSYRLIFPATQIFWTHLVGIGLAVYIEHENFKTVTRVIRRVMLAAFAQACMLAYQQLRNWRIPKNLHRDLIRSDADFLFWVRKGVASCLTMLAISYDMRRIHEKEYN